MQYNPFGQDDYEEQASQPRGSMEYVNPFSLFPKFSYMGMVRAIAFLSGVGVGIASIVFSVMGFGANNPVLEWVGFFLAIAVFAVQLMFTASDDINDIDTTMLFLIGLSYLYSIATNFVGLYLMQGIAVSFTVMLDDPIKALVTLIGATFADVFPEKAITWSVRHKGGDLLGNLIRIKRAAKNASSKGQPSGRRNARPIVPVRPAPKSTTYHNVNDQRRY